MKGLRVTVFRPPHSAPAPDGVTAGCDRVTLVGPGVPAEAAPSDDAPAVHLTLRDGCWIAVPESLLPDAQGPMFGGAYVWCSDARFRALSDTPIPVHDRLEQRTQPCR